MGKRNQKDVTETASYLLDVVQTAPQRELPQAAIVRLSDVQYMLLKLDCELEHARLPTEVDALIGQAIHSAVGLLERRRRIDARKAGKRGEKPALFPDPWRKCR